MKANVIDLKNNVWAVLKFDAINVVRKTATIVYSPNRLEFPSRFGCQDIAEALCQLFYNWNNRGHRHSEISLLTTKAALNGPAGSGIKKRTQLHPERFINEISSAELLPPADRIKLQVNADDEKI